MFLCFLVCQHVRFSICFVYLLAVFLLVYLFFLFVYIFICLLDSLFVCLFVCWFVCFRFRLFIVCSDYDAPQTEVPVISKQHI